MRVLVAAIVSVGLTGCGAQLGLNFQRSALRSSGDLSSTTQLELTSKGAVESEKQNIKKYAEELLKFIETGQVSQLPTDELEKKMKELVPAEFALFVDAAIGYLDSKTVDVDGKIGEDNVKRLKAFLIGVIAGADYYDVKDKKDVDTE